ncbi:MAG: cystathionine beta-lyase PatB [Thermovirga sp.]
MHMYDFENVVNRRGTDSLKWDGMDERFGPVPEDSLPMWVADMDFLSPPCVIEAILERAKQGVFGYVQAPVSIFEAVAEWMRAIHGWYVDPGAVTFCPGVMPAVGVAIRAFSKPGDGVVIQPPVYSPFFRIIEDNQRKVVENPLINQNGHFRMDLEDLKVRLADPQNRILLLCSPHNPVGRVWTKEELELVGRLCLDTDTLLLSDEIHADIVFKPFRHIPAASFDPLLAGNIITCVSPSKTFNIPGLQTAYAIISDPVLRDVFQASLRATAIGGHHSNFGLVAGDAAYRGGSAWRDAMLKYIMGNRDFAISFFENKMPWVAVSSPEGTYLLWLDFNKCREAEEVINERLIKKGKVVLDPGSWFGKEWSSWQRLNFACPRSLLEDGLERIRTAFDDLAI